MASSVLLEDLLLHLALGLGQDLIDVDLHPYWLLSLLGLPIFPVIIPGLGFVLSFCHSFGGLFGLGDFDGTVVILICVVIEIVELGYVEERIVCGLVTVVDLLADPISATILTIDFLPVGLNEAKGTVSMNQAGISLCFMRR